MSDADTAKPYRARRSRPRHDSVIDMRIRLPDRLEKALDREANRFALSRTRWVQSLVEHQLSEVRQFPREAELALIFCRSELRRLRREVARIDTGDQRPDLHIQLKAIADDLIEVRRQIDAAFAASGRYWRRR